MKLVRLLIVITMILPATLTVTPANNPQIAEAQGSNSTAQQIIIGRPLQEQALSTAAGVDQGGLIRSVFPNEPLMIEEVVQVTNEESGKEETWYYVTDLCGTRAGYIVSDLIDITGETLNPNHYMEVCFTVTVEKGVDDRVLENIEIGVRGIVRALFREGLFDIPEIHFNITETKDFAVEAQRDFWIEDGVIYDWETVIDYVDDYFPSYCGVPNFGHVMININNCTFGIDAYTTIGADMFYTALTYDYIDRDVLYDNDANNVPLRGPTWLVIGMSWWLDSLLVDDPSGSWLVDAEEYVSVSFPDFGDLETGDAFGYDDYEYDIAAYTSMLMVHYLIRNYGFSTIFSFYSDIQIDFPWQAAFVQNFGMTVEDFYVLIETIDLVTYADIYFTQTYFTPLDRVLVNINSGEQVNLQGEVSTNEVTLYYDPRNVQKSEDFMCSTVNEKIVNIIREFGKWYLIECPSALFLGWVNSEDVAVE